MPFANPIVGGGGTLIRDAIQSPNYVAGSAGWTVKRDGSAEFNNVTVRGLFATGAAGGANAYLTMDNLVDRTTIAFWNAAGTNDAFINSPQVAGVPTLGCNSGVGTIPALGVNGYARLWLQPARAQFEIVRQSDQLPQGGNVVLTDTQGRLRHSTATVGSDTGGNVLVTDTLVTLTRDSAGVSNGGRVRVDTTDGYLEYSAAGTGTNGVKVSVDGVRPYGAFPSEAGLSGTAQTGWSIVSIDLAKWGPFVYVTTLVQRTGVAVGPGAIASNIVQVNGLAGGPPNTVVATVGSSSNNGSATVSTGNMLTIQNVSLAIATGNQIRMTAVYYVG